MATGTSAPTEAAPQHKRPFQLTGEGWPYLLVPLIPVAVVLKLVHASPTWVFLASALGVVPTAALMGRATEELAARSGPGIGGFLNVTFGNAPELIIALFALGAGLHEVVKASIVGSILGNILLVLGVSMLAGGLRRDRQNFEPRAASAQALLLLLATVALVMPAIFELVQGPGLPDPRDQAVAYPADALSLSVGVAIVLLVSYGAGLVFSLKTHAHLFNPAHEEDDHGGQPWTVRRSVGMLAIAGAAVGLMSEILVGSITEASEAIGLSPFFVGVIVVAIVGNAAEHWVAVYFALRNKIDLSINIAVGSGADRAVRRTRAGAGLVRGRPLPDGAGVQRIRDRGDPAGGVHRPGGDPAGRLHVVRGAAAAGRLRGARSHLLLRLDVWEDASWSSWWATCPSRRVVPLSTAPSRRPISVAAGWSSSTPHVATPTSTPATPGCRSSSWSRAGWPRPGSSTQRILLGARCPVLAVKAVSRTNRDRAEEVGGTRPGAL
jgi:Ca2+:H+ antiporter